MFVRITQAIRHSSTPYITGFLSQNMIFTLLTTYTAFAILEAFIFTVFLLVLLSENSTLILYLQYLWHFWHSPHYFSTPKSFTPTLRLVFATYLQTFAATFATTRDLSMLLVFKHSYWYRFCCDWCLFVFCKQSLLPLWIYVCLYSVKGHFCCDSEFVATYIRFCCDVFASVANF